MKTALFACAASTFAIAATVATPAAAQDAASSLSDIEDGNEIVVTARRREERLLDVPISVTAISSETLAKKGTQTLEEIGEDVPNVTLEVSRGTNTTLSAFIRGIGQQDPVAGYEPGVGLYIDDVYLARPQAAVLDVYEVERIEVLRGPQGTLYGRNTIGGAIKYVTASLPYETTFKVRGTYGSYDQADVVVTASTPLSDGLRVGVSGARLSRGGFGDYVNQPGKENYNKDVWAARGTIEYDGGPLSIRLSGDYVKDNSFARQGHRLLDGLVTGVEPLDDVYDTRAGLDVVDQEVEAYGGALNIAYELNDVVTLKSITGYRKDKSTSPIDFDSLDIVDVDVPAIYKNDQFSQEFQLLYEGDRLNGVLGAYYLNASAFTGFDVALFTTGDLLNFLNDTTIYTGLNGQTVGEVGTDTWSIFGDFTYDLTDKISLSLGGRYTYDKRSSIVKRTSYVGGYSDLFGGDAIPFAVTSDFDGSRTFKEFTPRASLSFKPAPNHTLYATYSKGFKGGGFDPRGQTTDAIDLDNDGTVSDAEIYDFMTFDPEVVDSFEIGWKASLLDRRLNLSVAAFKNDYTDMQILGSEGVDSDGDGVFEAFRGITTNAASADINGFEIEFDALAGRDFAGMGSRFSVNGAVGYLDAKFNEFILNGADISDQRRIQNTPEWTVNWGFDLGLPVGGGIVDFLGSVSLRSDSQQFENPIPGLDQDGFALVNASVVYSDDADRFTIGVHAKNLFDKRYVVSGYNYITGDPNYVSSLGTEGIRTAFYGDPRRIFVTGEIRF
ncbi:TonB-dependent receptor [Croceicoccus naphthovorans]|uniref:TonB-dependent receptor n=1 Tax=Croceicoccus naphthovorans TaxID=1348774 RepID=A0A0G3XKK5_9SPHN|nr:TonB-dependent receptor [Croceicoccus naphthovorans]AKM11762.1 TonB-dependent receptor [Croceicoccus naphthovorans]MBB3990063.1 iron complex outermembrane receptor protein [Croceicoccus naphthovorans]